MARRLAEQGAVVTVTDPEALVNVRRVAPGLTAVDDTTEALRDADLVVLLTEWSEYVELNPAATAGVVNRPVIIDGRNALNPAEWRAAGWAYTGLGRATAPAA